MKTAHDLVMAAKARTQEVSLDDADEAIRDAGVLIDVREADEFAAGHLPGAVHIARGLLEFKLSGDPDLSPATSSSSSIAKPAAARPRRLHAARHGLSAREIDCRRLR